MNMKLLVSLLSLDEKKELLNELIKKNTEVETLKDFFKRNENNMSLRLYDDLIKAIYDKHNDFANCPVSKALDNDYHVCLHKVKGFRMKSKKEFIELRGY